MMTNLSQSALDEYCSVKIVILFKIVEVKSPSV